jgi:hypothetical protein
LQTLDILSGYSPGGTEEVTKNFTIVGVLAESRTQYLQNEGKLLEAEDKQLKLNKLDKTFFKPMKSCIQVKSIVTSVNIKVQFSRTLTEQKERLMGKTQFW